MQSFGDNGRPKRADREPVAIIGMACRLPGGVQDVESFWDLLQSGRSGIVEVPGDRWNNARYYHPDSAIPNRMHSKWGGFIEGLHDFDARFWGISPREAARMDPQQRWLLEVAWEAIEDAGIPASAIGGTATGVYVGIASSDYAQIQMTNHQGLDVHSNSGNTLSIAANRISYALDLKGPSISIDTACSSSLVAVSLACQALWDGTCEAAMVGGVNAVVVPSTTMAFSKASMLSPDGKCFTFDSRANGYVRGEGAGVLLLKPLSKAVRDGDRIYACILAAVTNQDGKTSSMTVPGADAQRAMLELAYREAGIPPSQVAYVEAHGTGTPLGDPIEATALGQVLSRGRAKDQPCLVGSVKTNIGHLEAGSGVAGLIKAALVLQRRQVPPNLNFVTANPSIPLEELQLEVPTTLRPLPMQIGSTPVTAVNSFGFGGANAHVVLAAAPEGRIQAEHRISPSRAIRPCVLPISGRDESALRSNVKAYVRFLRDESVPLNDVCAAAGIRKDHHSLRVAVVGDDAEQMRERLGLWLGNPESAEGVVAAETTGNPGPITFVFTGQGPQWWGMGQQLLAREPIVRDTIGAIDKRLATLADWSLWEELNRTESTSRVNETHIAQPAIFALQVALAELWKSWGVTPDQVMGHSVGEVAAAYIAGIYSLEDAVHVAFHRSRLQHATKGTGRMLAAGISAPEARQLIGSDAGRIHISAINSPGLVTFAGETEPLQNIARALEDSHKFFRWLGIDYAFHSHLMEPIRQELLDSLAAIDPQAGHIPFISTVTGGQLFGERLDAQYWWRNVRLPVLFGPALATQIRRGDRVFVEIGPHPSLRSSIEDSLADQGQRGAVYHSLRANTDESAEMLQNLAGLYTHGLIVDWSAINQSSGPHVRLPHYRWTHEKFWLEDSQQQLRRLADETHPLLGIRVEAVQPTWEFQLDPRLFPYLQDHQLWDAVVFPAAGYVEIGLALAKELFPDQPHCVESIEIDQALFAWEDKVTTVRVVFDAVDKSFRVYSATANHQEWELHVRGQLTPLLQETPDEIDLTSLKESFAEHHDHTQYYADLIAAGYGFGPCFRQIRNVWSSSGEALAEIEVPADLHDSLAKYHVHPAVIDACFQVFRAVQDTAARDASRYLFLPSGIRRLRLLSDSRPVRLWAHARQVSDDGKSMVCDIRVYDDFGKPFAEILGFQVDPSERQATGNDVENCFYRFQWELGRLRGTGTEGCCNFSTTAAMVHAANQEMPELFKQYGLDAYHRDFLPRCERINSQYVQNAVLNMGWTAQPGDRVSFEDLVRQLGIARQHHRVMRIQLLGLVNEGLLKPRGQDLWEVLRPPVRRDIAPLITQLSADYPRLAATEIMLSALNGEAADRLLTGEVSATEILFPGGSSKLVGRFYVDGLDFPVHNRLMAVAVARAIERLPSRRAVRVLEIGAGTGSLTKEVLPILPADRTEYLFTDIGPAFVTAAKSQFAKFPFVDYRTFDLEQPAKDQGLVPHGYDLILASAVLHATEDLKRTLANICTCLAPGGILMFIEPIHRRLVTDSIFGGLPGWWKFTDTDLRPDHALMGRAQWLQLLSDSGFEDIATILSAPTEEESEQAIFIAVAPAAEPSQIPEIPAGSTRGVPSGNGNGKLALDADVGDASAASLPILKTHLIFADQSAVAEGIVARYRELGERAVCVRIGQTYRPDGPDEYLLPIADDQRLRDLLVEVGRIETIVHCWSLDHPATTDLSVAALKQAQESGVLHVLQLAQVLVERTSEKPPRVYLITRDVQHVVDSDQSSRVASSPLIGLARVANSEHTSFRWTVIDLPFEPSPYETQDLFRELTSGDNELEVAYRQDRRYVNRLQRTSITQLPPRTRIVSKNNVAITPYRLQINKPGVLSNLTLNETPRTDPGPDEIEVRLMAGGINFRDVMKALGMYPGNPIDLLWLGDDFAGVVQRVGERVTKFRTGDRVAGMAPNCFRTFAMTDWRSAFPIPEDIAFQGGATLPTVFLTAHYALHVLARMQPGERILIHAAAGGVGQAAVQIAQDIGLEIFATAGSPEKRQLLKEMGVPHVMGSRNLDFADQIMQLTGGRGVDAVLNSLAGPFIPKSLAVLAPFGRFMEIGKVDVYNNTRIGLEGLKHNISYFVIDLAECLLVKRDLVATMFAALAEKFSAGTYRPLIHQVFPITEVVEAFRFMAQGQHVGKNVLSFDVDELPIGPCTEEGQMFRSDATYLISGGAGGFGLEVAKWMVRQGARHLVLMSRSGPRDVESREAIDALRAAGIDVRDVRGDVTDPEDVNRVVREIQASGPPLRGVLHGAMVLDDEFIADMTLDRFHRVLQPKMLGAWNLHTATRELPLEQFLCFSSFSAMAGGARQSNYNAGNHFLDCLAFHRRSLGLPALTVNWGGISGAGFVHRNQNIAEYFDKIGFHSISVEEATDVLQSLVPFDPGQVGVARIDWKGMERFSPFVAAANMFLPLTQEKAVDGGGASARPRIMGAPPDQRAGMVQALLSEQLAAVCGIEVSKVDPNTSIIKLGLDSLMAIELINRVETELGLVLPMGKVLAGPTLTELSETVVQILAYATDENPAANSAMGGEQGGMTVAEGVSSSAVESPLSELQLAHWFDHQMNPRAAHHVALAARMTPAPEVELMKSALHVLIQRHPSLIVSVSTDRGEPRQRSQSATDSAFVVHPPAGRGARDWTQIVSKRFQQPLDPNQGQTLRLEMFPNQDATMRMLLVAHPMVADARTIRALTRELIEIYRTLEHGGVPSTSATGISIASYVTWERGLLSGDAARRSLNFWTEHLDGAPFTIHWPKVRPVEEQRRASRCESHEFRCDDALAQQILLLSAVQNVAPDVIVLAAYELALHQFCQQSDLVLACYTSGRGQDDLRSAIGCLDRFVPLRSKLEGTSTVFDLLQRNQKRATDAQQHVRFSLAQLLKETTQFRLPGRPPICQAAFAMQRQPDVDPEGLSALCVGCEGHRARLDGFTLDATSWNRLDSNFELALHVEEASGRIFGCWQYRPECIDHVMVAQLERLVLDALRSMVCDPMATVNLSAALIDIGEITVPEEAVHRPADGSVSRFGSQPHRPAITAGFVAPRGESEHLVARVWEDLLDVRPIGAKDDFVAIGGHSLQAALISARLQQMFGIDVLPSVIFESSTVATLAMWLDTQRAADAPPIIDPVEQAFEKDAQLDPSIVISNETLPATDEFKRVLLTGATGFLGAYLLDELIRTTEADVYCLVRASSPGQGLQRIHQNLEKYGLDLEDGWDRVVPVPGDLGQPMLGLNEAQFDQLAQCIDAIYHNGAVLNFAYTYQVLRDSNVRGTHEILRLAMQHRLKPTHYVSTVAVLASVERPALDTVTEDDPLPRFSSLRDAYSQTKWMSERLIAEARKRGLPVTIYRPGGITGHSQTGRANVGDMIHVMALGCYQLGSVPHVNLQLSLAPVDFVAGALVELSLRSGCRGKTFHLVNPEPLRLDDFVKWFQSARLPMERKSYEHWQAQVTNLVETVPSDMFGLLTKFFMPGVVAGDLKSAIPPVLQLRYDCRQTVEYLAPTGRACPRMDESLLSLYLTHLRRLGVMGGISEEKEPEPAHPEIPPRKARRGARDKQVADGAPVSERS